MATDILSQDVGDRVEIATGRLERGIHHKIAERCEQWGGEPSDETVWFRSTGRLQAEQR
jgi:hypothetical protein